MFSAIKGHRSLETDKIVDDLKHPFTCPETGGALQGVYDYGWIKKNVDRDEVARRPRGIWRWSELLPVRDVATGIDLRQPGQAGPDVQAVLRRYHFPEPRLVLGRALRGYATAAVDVSDGLVADLGHILEASGVAGSIDASRLPLSQHLKRLVGQNAAGLALNAGDDYELCVTLPPQVWASLPEDVRRELTVIGEVVAGEGVTIDWGDHIENLSAGGYDHFRN